jgi:hypothetical protein
MGQKKAEKNFLTDGTNSDEKNKFGFPKVEI